MTTAVEDGAWVTYAQATALTRRADRTLRRAVKAGRVETLTEAGNGAKLLKVEDLIALGWIRPTDLLTPDAAVQTAELLAAHEQLLRLRVELGEARGRLAEREEHLLTLKGQVAEKDRQLRLTQATLQQLVGQAGRAR